MATVASAILWIDGVGGYLVCRSPAVTLGPAFADPPPDVPLLADVSRHHATLRRDGEGYTLTAEKLTAVNMTPVEETLLKSGDRITLGESCQVLFTRPEPLSASACLSIVSGHRFGQPVDGVLLMADTLILDRSPQAHVTVPDLPSRVVIYRNGDLFGIRASAAIRANGQSQRDRAVLKPGVPTAIEELTMTLEMLQP